MLERIFSSREKPVMIITDIPVKKEFEIGEVFSSMSNLNLLTSLRTGFVKNYGNIELPNHVGIKLSDIRPTYLTYLPPTEGDRDFTYSIISAKNSDKYTLNGQTFIIHKTDINKNINESNIDSYRYERLPFLKNTFIKFDLYNELLALIEEIRRTKPKLIIVAGKWTLMLLTGLVSYAETAAKPDDSKPLGGLVKYRSSMCEINTFFEIDFKHILVPIWHTNFSHSMPDKVSIMELDMRKLGWMFDKINCNGLDYFKKPEKTYIVTTKLKEILAYLDNLVSLLNEGPRLLSIDVETLYASYIDCIGIAISKDEGICIPFSTLSAPNLWSKEEEIEIMTRIYKILTHENKRDLGHNYSYDCQMFWNNFALSIAPKEDTLILHHILFNYLPKNLAFLASLYCDYYVYWKDDVTASKVTPENRWLYNVKDVCYTYEIFEILQEMLTARSKAQQELYRFQIDSLAPELDSTMNYGVKVNKNLKEELHKDFTQILQYSYEYINEILGFKFNINSNPQKKKLYKEYFGIQLKLKKVKNSYARETCDSAAMKKYIAEHPLYTPFLTLILETSALQKFNSTFLGMQLDSDDRARTQYKMYGTSTGRLSSTKNIWGKGGNFQNLPEKGKLPLRYILEIPKVQEFLQKFKSSTDELESFAEIYEEFLYNEFEELEEI